jgi:hypothetical protein
MVGCCTIASARSSGCLTVTFHLDCRAAHGRTGRFPPMKGSLISGFSVDLK